MGTYIGGPAVRRDMPDEERVTVDVEGLRVEEAVDTVLAADPSADREFVETAMNDAATGGVVRRSGVESSIQRVARAVSEAGSSQSMALMAFQTARDAAAPVADLPVVAGRLDAFEADTEALHERYADLQDQFDEVSDLPGESGSLSAAALYIREVVEDARDLEADASDLEDSLETFQEWLDDHRLRVRALEADLDAVEERIVELATIADELADADGERDGESGDGDEDEDVGGHVTDPAVAWCDAALQAEVTGIMLADVRAEATDLRTWADREDVDHDLGGVEDRLDDLTAERDRVADRLADVAAPAWTDQYGEQVDAFAAAVDDLEPPTDWGDVQAALERYRPEAADDVTAD